MTAQLISRVPALRWALLAAVTVVLSSAAASAQVPMPTPLLPEKKANPSLPPAARPLAEGATATESPILEQPGQAQPPQTQPPQTQPPQTQPPPYDAPPPGGNIGMPARKGTLLHLQFGLGTYLPLGPDRFGLAPFDNAATEFEWSPGFQLALGWFPSPAALAMGVRFDIGLGPLNSDAWADALGVRVDDSVLVDLALYASYHIGIGRHSLIIGVDGGIVSMGTTKSEQRENDEVIDSIDNQVRYFGLGSSVFASLQFPFPTSKDGSGHWYVQLRYGRRWWLSLETDGPEKMPRMRDDLDTLDLTHLGIVVGIGGVTMSKEKRDR